ncbi:alkaline shock response membrane anchor protein AmaP [Streptomyces sp. NPDC050560]|uniref:alkaline shock response membrane anchor protein AmaP n=1 Tax=Streptomyces sp. NPDC050560 TaxID=3365630 RepID=UPI00379BA273
MRTANRVLLALVGLVLLVLGGSVLAVGLGASPPSWWVHQGEHDVLLTRAERTRWRGEGWWWPVVIAVLAVLLLLALWWLAAALRRRRLGELMVDTRDGEGAGLRGRALETVMEGRAAALDGVSDADVSLHGRRTAPRSRVRLRLEPFASPARALRHLTTDTLAEARAAAGLRRLPTEAHLYAEKHRASRVQ